MAAWLGGCQKTTLTAPVNTSIPSPQLFPVTTYLEQAHNESGEVQNESLMHASARLIADGNNSQAQMLLNRLQPNSRNLQDEKNQMMAELLLKQFKFRPALQKLAAIHHSEHFKPYQKAKYYEMLANIYLNEGRLVESIQERTKLIALLNAYNTPVIQYQRLWQTFLLMPKHELFLLSSETTNDTIKGFAQLALIAKKPSENPQQFGQWIKKWQHAFPHHPAELIANFDVEKINAHQKIAVLLPLSGILSGPSHAIKKGINDANQRLHNASILYIDTASMSIDKALQHAHLQGATTIIGPLMKANVDKVNQLEPFNRTIIALNEQTARPQKNLYTLTLSPDIEAQEIAKIARQQGFKNALIIAPDDDWSRKIINAFTAQWQSLQGNVVKTTYFQKKSLNEDIRTSLKIDESELRGKAVKQQLGNSIHTNVVRSEDFDMIFLLAYPSHARQIMPRLRYYYLNQAPVYSLSMVYQQSQHTKYNRDLDNLWMLDLPNTRLHPGARTWSERYNSFERLYALGQMAYDVSTHFTQLQTFKALNLDGSTVYLDTDHHIIQHRVLTQIKDGRTHLIADFPIV